VEASTGASYEAHQHTVYATCVEASTWRKLRSSPAWKHRHGASYEAHQHIVVDLAPIVNAAKWDSDAELRHRHAQIAVHLSH
jgi:hypothetical protein